MSTTESESASIGYSAGVPRSLAEVLAGGNKRTWIRPIAGSGRRFIAFLLDALLLGLAGKVFAWSMPSTVYELGPQGHALGQLVVLVYFGVMNSRAGGGQTIGKRLMKIAVRDAGGHPIGIGRSLLRTSIWVLPMTLCGWPLPILDNASFSWSISGVGACIAAALVATMMFDGGSGRRLDDMLTHSYAVYLRGDPVEAMPPPPRRQWIVAAAAALAALVLFSVLRFMDSSGVLHQPMIELDRALQNDGRFFTVDISDDTVTNGRRKTYTLNIDVWQKGVPSEEARTLAMNDIARKALTFREVTRFDLIRINVRSAYDLGFATGNSESSDNEPVETWMDRLGKPATAAAVR